MSDQSLSDGLDSSVPTVHEFIPWMGLFETVRVIAGRPLLLTEHQLSLTEGSLVLGLPEPPDFTTATDSLPAQSGRWRWVHTPNSSHHFFQPEDLILPEIYSLELAPQRVGSHNWDALYKTLSYLTHTQARKSVHAEEALLLNEYAEVATGAMSNIFWVQHDQVFTPALELGCRNGAVRRWIFQHFSVEPTRADLTALQLADEIFLSSSMIGIKPVGEFDSRKLAVGPHTLAIKTAYEEAIKT
jgi:branched-subunit amino acid aminotransferase/4-amino-4-deoxychorismate lyase